MHSATAPAGVNAVTGGSTNIVPDECRFEFELRYLPGQDPQPILAEAGALANDLQAQMQAIAPEAGITVCEVAAYPPLAPAQPPAGQCRPPVRDWAAGGGAGG